MRSLSEHEEAHCKHMLSKERSHTSSSESNDDDKVNDIDETFEQFLTSDFLDQSTPPSLAFGDIMDEAMPDISNLMPAMEMEEGLPVSDMLVGEDLLLAPGGPDLIEGPPDATIDLSQLCPDGMKPEPCSPPSPDGSDSGVEAYSVGFEYCDTPPVTPPQVTMASTPAAIIQVIKQEMAPPRPLAADTQQVICLGSVPTPAVSQKMPMPRTAQRKTTPIRPAPSVVLPQTVSSAAVSTTYIITTPAAPPKPAAAIKPRPAAGDTAPPPRPPPVAAHVPKARPLPPTVTVPPPREAMDPRTLKRQERIIKNRMAACLSRKKKKDQFSEMEARVHQVEADNGRLRAENQQLHRRLAQLQAEVDMLRGLQAPASPPPSPRRPLLLLSILLMASLNLAPLGSLFSGPLAASEMGGGPAAEPSPGGRTLLWAPSEEQADLDYLSQALNASSGRTCPKYVNQTEARRLSRVLHGWFDAAPAPSENGTARADGRPTAQPTRPPPRSSRRRKRPFRKRHSLRPGELQLYDRWFGTYGPFMEAIRRRDDTFYVVSFNGDHLMLPAISHNQTQRPRMSLLLPSLPLNESMRAPEHYVAMMQIDCEVVNTKLLHIHESAVPSPPSNHSAPAGDSEPPLNATRAARRNFDFPARPPDAFPVDTALRWNGSTRAGRRDKKSRARGKTLQSANAQRAAPAANSTADAWRKLRFRNDSVDGAGDATAFRLPQPAAGKVAERRPLGRRRPRPRPAAAATPSADAYFQSEH